MRICVFGAGAVGSHFAVRLALAGHDVSCVMRGAHLDAVKANGLTLRVGNGEFKAKVRASSDPAALGPQDAVICTLKATGLSSLADGLPPLLGEDTAVVFAQNGIPWWYDIGLSPRHPPVPDLAFLDPGGRLRAAIPKQLIVGGVVFSSNEVVAARRRRKSFARAQPAPDRRMRRPRQRAGRAAACGAERSFDRFARGHADQGDDLVKTPDQHVDVGAVPVDRADRARRARRS